jgi:glycerol uptake facilitator-like aquaporin
MPKFLQVAYATLPRPDEVPSRHPHQTGYNLASDISALTPLRGNRMDNKLIRETLAELIGTFTLVFIGAAAVVVAPVFGVTVPALAHGLILVGLIYIFGHISGAQFNPAVTISLLVGGKQDITRSVVFIIAQFLGGIIAAFVLVALLPAPDSALMVAFLGEGGFNYGVTTGLLTPDHVWSAAIIEGLLAFFLVSAVYQAAVYGKAGSLTAVAIGLTLAASIFAGGALTGASVNPARTLGPALAVGDLSYVLPYFIGLFGGGVVGGLVHTYLFAPDATA